MLQQTQVKRVLEKYPEFLGRFPTLGSLARSRQRSVVIAWRGMGYNSRAVRLHRLSRIVMRQYAGRLPGDFRTLTSLPGIGPYTASAILNSAFRFAVPVVDVNIRRVLSRLFQRMRTTGDLRPLRDCRKLAGLLLPAGRAYEWNQALMDLGAVVCTSRSPHCGECPVAFTCSSGPTMKAGNPHLTRSEPSHNDIPHRIYRGRIVECLRTRIRTKGTSVRLIGKAIDPKFTERDLAWLNGLLDALLRDGILSVASNRDASRRRVMLA